MNKSHIERATILQAFFLILQLYGAVWNMQFCIFSINMRKLSSYAKSGTEVHTNAAKSIRIQPSAYFRICFCVPACNGPAEQRSAVATFPLLLATCWACRRSKFSLLLQAELAFGNSRNWQKKFWPWPCSVWIWTLLGESRIVWCPSTFRTRFPYYHNT